MKKIFAIALAAVMVLSMASAFALTDCYANFAWPCDVDELYCGRGTIEVVPVVRVNNACGGSEFQINECAGVVAGENIYFALKLNVDANPDHSSNDPAGDQTAYWWDNATLAVTASPAADVAIVETTPTDFTATGIDWDANKAKSYYYSVEDTAWVDVTDKDLEFDDVVFTATTKADTTDASKVKVCAVIESYCDGMGDWVYGDYEVSVASGSLTVKKGTDTYVYTYNEATGVDKVEASAEFAKEVEKLFNLSGCSLGTCLTDKNIEKNFGWNNTVEDETEIEDCFNWSNKAAAIVDAECVVAIPKTGDASLLAWLF